MKKHARKLLLARQTITNLTDGQLGRAGGGSDTDLGGSDVGVPPNDAPPVGGGGPVSRVTSMPGTWQKL